jgi:hypothetical protein
LERAQIVGMPLAGAYVKLTYNKYYSVYHSESFYGYVSIHESSKDDMRDEEQRAKINFGKMRRMAVYSEGQFRKITELLQHR